jgi:hypothetical protein
MDRSAVARKALILTGMENVKMLMNANLTEIIALRFTKNALTLWDLLNAMDVIMDMKKSLLTIITKRMIFIPVSTSMNAKQMFVVTTEFAQMSTVAFDATTSFVRQNIFA